MSCDKRERTVLGGQGVAGSNPAVPPGDLPRHMHWHSALASQVRPIGSSLIEFSRPSTALTSREGSAARDHHRVGERRVSGDGVVVGTRGRAVAVAVAADCGEEAAGRTEGVPWQADPARVPPSAGHIAH